MSAGTGQIDVSAWSSRSVAGCDQCMMHLFIRLKALSRSVMVIEEQQAVYEGLPWLVTDPTLPGYVPHHKVIMYDDIALAAFNYFLQHWSLPSRQFFMSGVV